ncbi:MAG TPA: PAC2 family protein [Planctomycetes bacterium]|nr:PAC2 family protein [Planctomycetota bacterium]
MRSPWLLAGWPGMGSVALGVVSYLIDKFEGQLIHTIDDDRFFEVDHVTVDGGIIRSTVGTQCNFYRCSTPKNCPDLIVMVSRAQPQFRGFELCQAVVSMGRRLGARRVINFAAITRDLAPKEPAKIFCCASNADLVASMNKEAGIEPLHEGRVIGLNGLLMEAVRRDGLDACCLLGEIPYYATDLPNPKSVLNVLRGFYRLLGLVGDFEDLEREAEEVEEKLVQLFDTLDGAATLQQNRNAELLDVIGHDVLKSSQSEWTELEQAHIEELFRKVGLDKARAIELKRELDRLQLYNKYEDRFLDLFKQAE